MSGRILSFTPGGQARAPAVAGTTAAIVLFPSARHVQHLSNVIAWMRACPDAEAAKVCLASHVEVLWARLDDLGVADDVAESDLRTFAAAALGAYFCGDGDGYGAA